MKIVINVCFGGFGLSEEAYRFLGLPWDNFGYAYEEKRTDEKLIACVEALGERASGRFAELKVIEIPDNIEYTIEDYDGVEWVAEAHRTWE